MVVAIIVAVFQIYTLMLFIRIISSWIPELQNTKFMHFISFYTDPYLNIFRKVIPPLGMFDISPIFAFIALELIKYLILGLFQ